MTILQFFTGLELLAITAVTGAFCAAGVVIIRPRLVLLARKQLLIATSIGAVIAGVVLAYPLWFYLAGPRHVQGPFWPMNSSKPWRIIDAGQGIFHSSPSLSTIGYLGARGPGTDFLGFGLLLALLISFPLWRKRTSCVIIAGVGVLTWLCESFPKHLLAKLPFLSSMEVTRFALPVSLCVGLLLAGSIDSWWSAVTRWWPSKENHARRTMARVVIAVLVVAAFFPLLNTYSVPFRVTTANEPSWYKRNATHLAPGTAVLTLPFAYGVKSQPMAWQAESDDAFDLIGGWAFVPGGNGVKDEIMSPLKGPVEALHELSRWPSCTTVSEENTIRSALMKWRPLVIVEVPHFAKPGTRAAMTATSGLAPRHTNGAWVWTITRATHLGAMLKMRRAPSCRTSDLSKSR